MWPAIRPGFTIRFRAVDPETLSPGDIVVLRSRGRRGEAHVRVHRLLGRAGPWFVEAGDNAYAAALVAPEDILGLVVAVRDREGKGVTIAAPSARLERRFRFLLGTAHAFMFAHELKDRVLGSRRSLVLWRLSQLYRFGVTAAGLRVPVIAPNATV
jgi:hypothetical protein